MTMYPNCREKYTKDAYPIGMRFRKYDDIPENEINPYWEENLEGANKTYVEGYDKAVEEVMNILCNKDFLAEQTEEYFGRYLELRLDEAIVNSKDDLSQYSCDAIRDMNTETLAVKVLQCAILDWLETVRDEMVTALIDTQYD